MGAAALLRTVPPAHGRAGDADGLDGALLHARRTRLDALTDAEASHAAQPVVGTAAMCVDQLASAVRVPPQVPNGAASYCASVHVCAMYSLAIHTVSPTTDAAP
jgi:hypothetical protein